MYDSDEDDNTVDLSGLSANDLALHESLSSILSCETAILDPDDADNLALAIVNEMPPVYNAAPELFTMLSRMLDSVLRLPELPATFSQLDIEQCRKALDNAVGD